MFAPMARATCGVPVTVAGSWNSTVTAISSSAMKTPPAPCPIPERVTPTTVGPPVSAAAALTTRSPSVTACSPRPSEAAFPAASAIVPPSGASAVAATEIPFESASPETTV